MVILSQNFFKVSSKIIFFRIFSEFSTIFQYAIILFSKGRYQTKTWRFMMMRKTPISIKHLQTLLLLEAGGQAKNEKSVWSQHLSACHCMFASSSKLSNCLGNADWSNRCFISSLGRLLNHLIILPHTFLIVLVKVFPFCKASFSVKQSVTVCFYTVCSFIPPSLLSSCWCQSRISWWLSQLAPGPDRRVSECPGQENVVTWWMS